MRERVASYKYPRAVEFREHLPMNATGKILKRSSRPVDRMSPLDAAFLQAEDEEAAVSLAIASIAVFEGRLPPRRSSAPSSPDGCR